MTSQIYYRFPMRTEFRTLTYEGANSLRVFDVKAAVLSATLGLEGLDNFDFEVLNEQSGKGK